MYKIYVLLLLLSCQNVFAQIRNASFEQTDSLGEVMNWQVTEGSLTQFSSKQFGVIPFTAYHGNYFVLLQSDTTTPTVKAGLFSQSFAFADTPASIQFPFFYIPESLNQRAGIELYFSKWNGTSRDTILYLRDTIAAVADSNQIRIQWNVYATTLKGFYTQHTLPDSVHLSITNDQSLAPGKLVQLYIDQISFGQWAVGLPENNEIRLDIFPNPAQEFVTVKTSQKPTHLGISGMDGKQWDIPFNRYPGGFDLNVSSLANGLYIVTITIGEQTFRRRLLVNHEN